MTATMKENGKGIIMYNKNIDIKFGVHDMFLGQPSSGTLKSKRSERQII